MKVKCPACGAAMSLDALIGHDEARAALVAVSGISDELVRGCLKYLGLFRPLEKDLTFARVAKLVGELRPMMAAGQISRNRQDYPAPREAWLWAFEQVLVARDNGKLQRLPLTTHGFLLETLTFWAPAKSQAAAPVPFVPTDGGLQVNTKLRQGVAALAAWAGGDWLRQEQRRARTPELRWARRLRPLEPERLRSRGRQGLLQMQALLLGGLQEQTARALQRGWAAARARSHRARWRQRRVRRPPKPMRCRACSTR